MVTSAKIKYDVSDVEEFVPYSGPTPKRGIYVARVVDAEWTKSNNGNMMFKFTLRIEDKKKEHKQYDGCPLFQIATIGDLSEDWMKRNLKFVIKTFGLKEKGEFDPNALVKKVKKDEPLVRVIVKNENSDEYGLQAKANGLLPLKGEDAEEAADEEDAEEPEGEEPEGDEEEGEEEDDGLDELDRAGLRKFIKDNDLDIKVTRAKSDDDLRTEIREAVGDEEDEDEEDEGSVEDEIKDLDRTALKAYIKDNKLEVTVKKSMSDDDIREAIVEAWPDEDEEGEDDTEPPF